MHTRGWKLSRTESRYVRGGGFGGKGFANPGRPAEGVAMSASWAWAWCCVGGGAINPTLVEVVGGGGHRPLGVAVAHMGAGPIGRAGSPRSLKNCSIRTCAATGV